MAFELDFRVENTTVELLLRRVRQHLRHQAEGPNMLHEHCDGDAVFENLRLEPDVYASLDYAAQLYDPREVPANTRFLGLKRFLSRLMRVYTTRQVEFNATVVRLANRFFDLFHESIKAFEYFRGAEERLTRRIEHLEQVAAENAALRLHIEELLRRLETEAAGAAERRDRNAERASEAQTS
jgi:hypothetical protein